MSSENLDLTTQVGEVKSYSGDEIKNYFENPNIRWIRIIK